MSFNRQTIVSGSSITPVTGSTDQPATFIMSGDTTNFTLSIVDSTTCVLTGTPVTESHVHILAQGAAGGVLVSEVYVAISGASATATVQNSDVTYQQQVAAGDTLILDDYTYTVLDENGATLGTASLAAMVSGSINTIQFTPSFALTASMDGIASQTVYTSSDFSQIDFDVYGTFTVSSGSIPTGFTVLTSVSGASISQSDYSLIPTGANAFTMSFTGTNQFTGTINFNIDVNKYELWHADEQIQDKIHFYINVNRSALTTGSDFSVSQITDLGKNALEVTQSTSNFRPYYFHSGNRWSTPNGSVPLMHNIQDKFDITLPEAISGSYWLSMAFLTTEINSGYFMSDYDDTVVARWINHIGWGITQGGVSFNQNGVGNSANWKTGGIILHFHFSGSNSEILHPADDRIYTMTLADEALQSFIVWEQGDGTGAGSTNGELAFMIHDDLTPDELLKLQGEWAYEFGINSSSFSNATHSYYHTPPTL